MRDFPLAFVHGLPSAILSVWFLVLASPVCPSGAPEVKAQGCGELVQHRSTSTRPLPAEYSSISGPPRLTAKPACWHLRASFTGDLAQFTVEAHVPAKLPDLRQGPSLGLLIGGSSSGDNTLVGNRTPPTSCNADRSGGCRDPKPTFQTVPPPPPR